MAITRKRLWIATYAALCGIALYLILFPPKRKPHLAPELPVPAAQLGSGSGCDSSELPRSLLNSPPAVADTEASGETPQMKQARLRATACVIRKLWPSAKLQFGWDEKGTGHFELIFPNRAYRRASAITFSRVASDKASVTMGGFVWLPRERELAMPPFVVARTDAEGNVNYYRALEIDPAAEITEERLPAWVPTDDERFIFRYEGEYQGGTRIEWIAIVDGSAAEFVQRVPQRITLGGVEWALSSGESDGASMVLRAEHAGESRSVRVKCERSSGANCVVGVDDLIGEMRFATS